MTQQNRLVLVGMFFSLPPFLVKPKVTRNNAQTESSPPQYAVRFAFKSQHFFQVTFACMSRQTSRQVRSRPAYIVQQKQK